MGMQDGACKFTCDSYAQYAGFQFTAPTCSKTHKSPTFGQTWEAITNGMANSGCCGPDGESACYVDVSGAVCKDNSSCALHRCRLYAASLFFPFSFLLSLSTLSLYILSDIMSHSQIILHHNVFMTGFALCLCLSLFLSLLRSSKPLHSNARRCM